MDVMEYQYVEDLNPYYLAAKYGGFTVPTGYDITQTATPLTQGLEGSEMIRSKGSCEEAKKVFASSNTM